MVLKVTDGCQHQIDTALQVQNKSRNLIVFHYGVGNRSAKSKAVSEPHHSFEIITLWHESWAGHSNHWCNSDQVHKSRCAEREGIMEEDKRMMLVRRWVPAWLVSGIPAGPKPLLLPPTAPLGVVKPGELLLEPLVAVLEKAINQRGSVVWSISQRQRRHDRDIYSFYGKFNVQLCTPKRTVSAESNYSTDANKHLNLCQWTTWIGSSQD